MWRLPRFGADVVEARKRIARILDRETATKRAFEARGPDFVPQDARAAPASERPKAPGGPSVWDAAQAIEEMEAEKERQRETAASVPADTQLAQNTQGGSATAEPDEFTDDDWLRELAFQNTSAWEQYRDKIYYDSRGVPTIGYGYGLLFEDKRKPKGKRWTVREAQDLRNIGLDLSAPDLAYLQTAADVLNKPTGQTVRPAETLYQYTLPEAQARSTFDAVFPEYLGTLRRALRDTTDTTHHPPPDRWTRLSPEQKAALFDVAYQRPAWLLNDRSALQQALDQDWLNLVNKNNEPPADGKPEFFVPWAATARWISKHKENRADQLRLRARNNADSFRHFDEEYVYQAQQGDNPTRIARKIGMTLQEFLQRYPAYRNRDVRSGELFYFKPTYDPDLRGRAP